MSYGRDPDRFTRGVGAIASRDNVAPGKALTRARAKVARTNARDRVMRSITLGPRGGMSGLGALNLGYQSKDSATLQPGGGNIGFEGAGKGGAPSMPGGGGVGPGASPWSPAALQQLATPSTATFNTNRRTLVMDPATPPPSGGGTITDPVLVTKKPVPVTKATTNTGGGGTWVPPAKLPPSVDMPPDVAIPDVPASSGMSNNTKLAILGAAALGAYFLFRNKKRAGGSP